MFFKNFFILKGDENLSITLEDLDAKIKERIVEYKPQGGLDHTAKIFLALCRVNHRLVVGHAERVALLSEEVAKKKKKDPKAAFFGGLLHDTGKLILPPELFDGHNISADEYERIKTHAVNGFLALKEFHLFTALCASLHHAMYAHGYGLTKDDFPKDFDWATMKKVLEISAIISVCDFVDAFKTRNTKILDGSDTAPDLKGMLQAKYPNDLEVIDDVLEIADSSGMY